MGGPSKVILSVALTPNDVDADFPRIEKDVKEKLKGIVEGEIVFKLEPIAFGLKSLNASFIMEEKHGSEIIETKLAEIKGVQTVEIKGVSLYEDKEFKPLVEEAPKGEMQSKAQHHGEKEEKKAKPAKKASKKK